MYSFTMLDAVLFEFDGVLADTAPARRAALTSVLAEDGVVLSPDEYQQVCAGLGLDEGVRAALALRSVTVDETALELMALRAERAFREHLGKGLSLVEGAREVVERLAGGTLVGIVTRTRRSEVEFALALARMEHAFSCVIAAEDAYPQKPAAAPYLTALERLGKRRRVRPRHVVALEDGRAGIRAARAAGVRCAVVGALPAHLAMDADALLPSIAGLTLGALESLVMGEERIR